ncbi:sensor histidine kinase [Leptolyngbya sp. FACHB-261]|uniref:sensor histidine kinase n=1 Tax=Leptolyngbya sp. FACHB-261 TaxID=2692806 RepID=UPI001684C765|nr:ATP-binding protein [Leptolyngbya sp. FACHB-261]MBD2100746.1 two-component sensor histidine kinase [Leptolyngbya sp. FACHB-261]
MARSAGHSFRRTLLTRILLLSVPVLLLGEAVAYRKARTSLLDQARRYLAESALRQAATMQSWLHTTQGQLLTATNARQLTNPVPEVRQQFLNTLVKQVPPEVKCIDLTNTGNGMIEASSCPANLRMNVKTLKKDWFLTAAKGKTFVSDPVSPGPGQEPTFVLAAPVYGLTGRQTHVLSFQSQVRNQAQTNYDSPAFAMVVDSQGNILTHASADRVGDSIWRVQNAKRLQSIVSRALRGEDYFAHFYNEQNEEWLAGFSSISIDPPNQAKARTWAVLMVSPLAQELKGLDDILLAMITLVGALLAANVLATIYFARDLALPLETLGKEAQRIRDRRLNPQAGSNAMRIPQNFRIREMNQLAATLNEMVNRLEARARELEVVSKEAEEASRIKSVFLANTSHELRNPLNAIINLVRLVRDGFCDNKEEELDFLKRADDAAVHLLGIINDVLDIASIESGKELKVTLGPVDLNRLLLEVSYMCEVKAQEKKLALIMPKTLGTPLQVRADPVRLKQVLVNVVGNAIKFTDSGSVTVSTRLDRAKGEVEVLVIDTGVGVDPKQQAKLFQRFAQADGSTTRRFQGTGLGLSISRDLMKLMDGWIDLYSAGENCGTEVRIRLKLLSTGNVEPLEPSTTATPSLPESIPEQEVTERLTAQVGPERRFRPSDYLDV